MITEYLRSIVTQDASDLPAPSPDLDLDPGSYCCALHIYCKEKQYTKLLKDGFDLNKQVKSWDMKALSQGFDFEKYSVFTYAK